MEEEENQEINPRTIILDPDEINMTVTSNNVNEPYISQPSHYTKNEIFQIRSFLRIWLHLLKKSVMKNFIFGPVSSPPSSNSVAISSSGKGSVSSNASKNSEGSSKDSSELDSFYFPKNKKR